MSCPALLADVSLHIEENSRLTAQWINCVAYRGAVMMGNSTEGMYPCTEAELKEFEEDRMDNIKALQQAVHTWTSFCPVA